MKHAVLALKITEINNKAAIYIYENEDQNRAYEAIQDLNSGNFSYSSGYNSYQINDRIVPFDFNSNYETFLAQQTSNLLSQNLEAVCVGCPVNMLVTDNQGNTTGFDQNGIRTENISGALIERYASDTLSQDSGTIIYVPRNVEYNVTLFPIDNGIMRFEFYKPLETNNLFTSMRDSIVITPQSVMTFNDNNPYKIQVDSDNDGEIDYNIPLNTNVYENGIPKVPLKTWPLFIAISLIAVFTILKYRKVI